MAVSSTDAICYTGAAQLWDGYDKLLLKPPTGRTRSPRRRRQTQAFRLRHVRGGAPVLHELRLPEFGDRKRSLRYCCEESGHQKTRRLRRRQFFFAPVPQPMYVARSAD